MSEALSNESPSGRFASAASTTKSLVTHGSPGAIVGIAESSAAAAVPSAWLSSHWRPSAEEASSVSASRDARTVNGNDANSARRNLSAASSGGSSSWRRVEGRGNKLESVSRRVRTEEEEPLRR